MKFTHKISMNKRCKSMKFEVEKLGDAPKIVLTAHSLLEVEQRCLNSRCWTWTPW